MARNSILISNVIVTHNRRETVLEHLELLKQQTMPPDSFEVVVVSDYSTDGTESAVKRFSAPYKLSFFDTRPGNTGAAAARNLGIAKSQAPIVVLHDDDTMPSPRLLDDFYPVVRSGVVAIGKDGLHDAVLRSRKPQWTEFVVNVAVSKRDVLGVGGYDEQLVLYGLEDLDLGYRLAKAGCQFTYVPSAAVKVLDPPYNISPKSREEKRQEEWANRRIMKKKHPDWPEILIRPEPFETSMW